jgi:hypothetical protein
MCIRTEIDGLREGGSGPEYYIAGVVIGSDLGWRRPTAVSQSTESLAAKLPLGDWRASAIRAWFRLRNPLDGNRIEQVTYDHLNSGQGSLVGFAYENPNIGAPIFQLFNDLGTDMACATDNQYLH